jgi:hypothetical protein
MCIYIYIYIYIVFCIILILIMFLFFVKTYLFVHTHTQPWFPTCSYSSPPNHVEKERLKSSMARVHRLALPCLRGGVPGHMPWSGQTTSALVNQCPLYDSYLMMSYDCYLEMWNSPTSARTAFPNSSSNY